VYPKAIKESQLKQSKGIRPRVYQKMLGIGIDVDWLKTKKGMKHYNEQVVKDFKEREFSHVRLRVKEYETEKILPQIKTVVNNCLRNKLIPILSFQADDFKNNPNPKELARFVSWWKKTAQALQNYSQELSFDLIIEVTDTLNKNPEILNVAYEKVVSEIRKTNPDRNIFISPIVRSAPENLHLLKIPTQANDHILAEFHFYASGPSKTNTKKLWTIGTAQEKQIIKDKIKTALDWQYKTGIPVWVGAWMPGNYNKGNDYTIKEQIVFAQFVVGELRKADTPFAINSGKFFYDYETGTWDTVYKPILDIILR